MFATSGGVHGSDLTNTVHMRSQARRRGSTMQCLEPREEVAGILSLGLVAVSCYMFGSARLYTTKLCNGYYILRPCAHWMPQ